jgi:hypothetical protein
MMAHQEKFIINQKLFNRNIILKDKNFIFATLVTFKQV